jgi:hypothetical protein
MIVHVGIDEGKLVLATKSRQVKIALNDQGGIQKFFKDSGANLECILYSSSTDFPDEYGAPKDYDARSVVHSAFGVHPRPKDLVLISKADLLRIQSLAKEKGFYGELQALGIQFYDP